MVIVLGSVLQRLGVGVESAIDEVCLPQLGAITFERAGDVCLLHLVDVPDIAQRSPDLVKLPF